MPNISKWLKDMYDSLPSSHYGWWLTTREHQDVATLMTAVQFIYGRFGKQPGFLSDHDYDDLQRALGRSFPKSGAKTVLDRHLLLNMWRPLRLLDRVRTNRRNPFQLTDYGLELAHSTEPRRVLESILRDMTFVHAEWSRPGVTASYAGISVRPYEVLKAVLNGVGGYLAREEYRLFVSRMRMDDDNSINEVIELIGDFRTQSENTRASLLALEATLFPKNKTKTYQNWVDMDLHTFSLFSLGTQFRRNDTVLVLSGTAVDATVANAFVFPQGSAAVHTHVPDSIRRPVQRELALKTPAAGPAFDIPPRSKH